MLSADITKVLIPEIYDYFAKSFVIEMRTSVIGAKLEMSIAVVRNAALDSIAVATVKVLVSFESIIVNTYLPANAAAVLTSVGNTFKAFIIFRCVQLHNNSFNASTVFLMSE